MICLVTGSSRGLGKAIALKLGQAGHKVVVHYKDRRDDALVVSSEIKKSMVVRADVRSRRDVNGLVGEVIEQWGRIDLLVNNAGITKESLLIKTTEDDFNDIIDTNLKGAFNLLQAVGRQMMKQKEGRIVNVSSYAGMKGKEGLSAYSVSKSGLIGLTRSAARELGRYNIMVNAILPGYMLTDMGKDSTGMGKEKALRDSIIKDFSDPDNVAEFVNYLSRTKGITGQVFNLDSRIY